MRPRKLRPWPMIQRLEPVCRRRAKCNPSWTGRSSRTRFPISSRAAPTAATPNSAGKDRAGQAPIMTSCGSNRRAQSATALSMTGSSNSSTAARLRPISICRAACAATSIHGPRATGPHWVFRALPRTSSILKSPALSAARAISPPNWKPHTTFCSRNASSCSRKSSSMSTARRTRPAWSVPGFPTSILVCGCATN